MKCRIKRHFIRDYTVCSMTKIIFSERNTFFMEIISCDPSVYRMEHLKFITSNQKEEFIRAYRVSGSVIECLTQDLGAAASLHCGP